MPVLADRRLAVLDVETTGWSPAGGHTVIEVARVTVENGAITDSWSSLVGPRRPISEESTRVHGITEAMLAEAPEPPAIARALWESCSGHPLVFHNAAFDLPFLRALMRAGGQPALLTPVVDTLGLAKGLFGSGSNTLGELAARFELPPEGSHRALGDARTTAWLLITLTPRWEAERGVRSFAQLAAASQDAVREAARRSVASRVASEAAT